MEEQTTPLTQTPSPATPKEPPKRLHLLTERKATRYSFDSILDLVDWLEQDWERSLLSPEGTPLPDGPAREWYSHGEMERSFCSYSWEGAVKEALTGEARKAKDFSKVVESISSKLETDLPRLTHGVTGQALDVGAFLSGEPECFLQKLPRPAPKCIPVWVDMSFVCHIPEKLIHTRAAAITALVDELQFQGFAVDLHVQVKTKLDEKPDPLVVDVEVETRPVDVNVLSFLCSTAFFRRFTFAVSEHYCRKNYPGYGGYGRGVALDRTEEPGFLFVGSYDYDWCSSWWSSEEAAKDHILGMVKEYMERVEPGPVVG